MADRPTDAEIAAVVTRVRECVKFCAPPMSRGPAYTCASFTESEILALASALAPAPSGSETADSIIDRARQDFNAGRQAWELMFDYLPAALQRDKVARYAAALLNNRNSPQISSASEAVAVNAVTAPPVAGQGTDWRNVPEILNLIEKVDHSLNGACGPDSLPRLRLDRVLDAVARHAAPSSVSAQGTDWKSSGDVRAALEKIRPWLVDGLAPSAWPESGGELADKYLDRLCRAVAAARPSSGAGATASDAEIAEWRNAAYEEAAQLCDMRRIGAREAGDELVARVLDRVAEHIREKKIQIVTVATPPHPGGTE